MNIVVIGCGKVGTTLVEQLCTEGHDIVAVDLSEKALESVAKTNDIMTLVGNGASFTIQQEAGVETADLLIAVTGSDELNLLCCLIAKKAGSCHTIARVRNSLYSRELGFIKEKLGISMIINPELSTAREIAKLLRFPSAIKIDTFAKGRVELMKFKLMPEFGLDGWKVSDIIERLKCDVLVCAVERGERVTIPKGNFVLHNLDSLSIMASHSEANRFFKKIGVETHQVKNALILGGGEIGYYLARFLLEMGIEVRIVELKKERCETLSELLPEAIIINGDATDQQLLMEEGLTRAEAVVSLTNIDEENLLLSMFARKQSKAKVVTKVNRIAFNEVIDTLDIGSVIYPKYLTANYITKYVRAAQNSIDSNVETLYKILDGRAEALEFSIHSHSPVVDIPLQELNLKPDLLVCCINRRGVIRIPRGQDRIQLGDTVMVVTTQKGLGDIRDILKNERQDG